MDDLCLQHIAIKGGNELQIIVGSNLHNNSNKQKKNKMITATVNQRNDPRRFSALDMYLIHPYVTFYRTEMHHRQQQYQSSSCSTDILTNIAL